MSVQKRGFQGTACPKDRVDGSLPLRVLSVEIKMSVWIRGERMFSVCVIRLGVSESD